MPPTVAGTTGEVGPGDAVTITGSAAGGGALWSRGTGGQLGEVPESIGEYRVLGVLGEGGMGVVFEAEQQHPRRRVALKVMRRGHRVDAVHARLFQREAETLARLKHPNIAAIYESGHTQDGHDFFAMELVVGETLHAWLERRPATVGREELELRLRIFRTICDAVHYAHQRSVIHRDLKPSNIVVTEPTAAAGSSATHALPTVKILDFGLARVTDADQAAATMASEVGTIKGTLPYMSPEQARGASDTIDVRTDVYALGIILYELVTGTRPYDVSPSALIEAIRVICEEPPRPLRLAWSGAYRLDGDIETIVGKALEKEPDRRYASVAALSEDVERFLTSQPILARSPSAAYQVRKFARRHRTLVAAFGAALGALLLGLGGTVWGFREARAEAERSRHIAAFMQEMVSGVDPAVAQGEDTTLLRRILDDTGARVDRELDDQPVVAASLHGTIGATYSALGAYDAGEKHLQASLDLHRGLFGDDDPRTLDAAMHVAVHRSRQGHSKEAESLYRETLERCQRILGDDHRDTLRARANLAVLLASTGREQEAVKIHREVLAARRRLLGDDHEHTLISINSLGVALLELDRYDEAEPLLVESLERHRRVLGEDHPETSKAVNNLGSLYGQLGRGDEADELLIESLGRLRQVLGDRHPTVLSAIHNLGHHYLRRNRLDLAEQYLTEALEGRRGQFGPEHPYTLTSLVAMATLRATQGRDGEAEQLFHEVEETRIRVSGPDHPETMAAAHNLAQFLARRKRLEEAVVLRQGLVERAHKALGDDDPVTLLYLNELGLVLTGLGRYDEAEGAYLQALEGRRQVLGERHPASLVSLNCLAVHYMRLKRWSEAEPLLVEALAGQEERLGPNHVDTHITRFNLGWVALESGDPATAEQRFQAAAAGFTRWFGPSHPNVRAAKKALAETYTRQGRAVEAANLSPEPSDG